MENALVSANASAILVAGAGNDKTDINAVDALDFSLGFFQLLCRIFLFDSILLVSFW
jgi:hypothetical protein